MKTVIDYSAERIPASTIRSNGHVGAVRYISPPREKWMGAKPVTGEELSGFEGNNLGAAFVWQYGGAKNPDAIRGYEGGKADAMAAKAKLRELGKPNHPVFFAVDFDISLSQWNATAVNYFKACCDVLGRDRVGIYGHSRVCDWAREDGVIGSAGGGKYLQWQTTSWSGGAVSKHAVLLQRTHNVKMDRYSIDINDVLHDNWGQLPVGSAAVEEKKKKEEQVVADKGYDVDMHHVINFGRSTPLPKKVIIVHTTENNPGTPAENVLNWQARSRTGSYHRLVDTQKIVLANTDDWQVWAVGNRGNDIALHVSCVAWAKMTREEWLAHPKMLDNVARVIAYWARTYDIPLVKLSRAELGAGKSGVAGHLEAQVWGNTTHWDPGTGFPYDVVLDKAKKINAGGGTPAPAEKKEDAPVKRAPITLDTPCKSHVAGSEHIAPLADYIMYIDRGVYEGRHQIDQVYSTVQRVEAKQDEILALLKEQKKAA